MAIFGNKKKKKDSSSLPDLPKLDFALTASTLALFLTVCVLFVVKGQPEALAELCVWVAVTLVAILSCKPSFGVLGRCVSTRASLEMSRNLRKFADQGWQLVVHVTMTACELHLLNGVAWVWWTDSGSLWKNPWQMESGRLEAGADSPPEIRRLYLVQLAIWFVTAYFHKFVEARHNDYFLMFSHHVVTILLLTVSYFMHWDPVGVVVLFIHDSSDIVVDILKMVNYAGLDSSVGLPLAEIAFVINLVTWSVTRGYYFWHKAIMPSLPLGWGYYPVVSSLLSLQNLVRGLLMSLAMMHVWWYFLFLKILAKLLVGTPGHDAGRDYEGSSDSEAEDTDDGKKAD